MERKLEDNNNEKKKVSRDMKIVKHVEENRPSVRGGIRREGTNFGFGSRWDGRSKGATLDWRISRHTDSVCVIEEGSHGEPRSRKQTRQAYVLPPALSIVPPTLRFARVYTPISIVSSLLFHASTHSRAGQNGDTGRNGPVSSILFYFIFLIS